jgi:hypothetical protein
MKGSENAGTVQRFVGHLSQEEQNMVATVGQNFAQKHEGRGRDQTEKKSVGQNMTCTKKWTNRVKGKNLILKTVGWVRWQPRVENCARKAGNNTRKYDSENERVQN